ELREKMLPKTTDIQLHYRQRFLPEYELEKILTVRVVKEIIECARLNGELERQVFDIEELILGGQHGSKRTKIFATLVLIEEPAYITNFVKHHIWDDQLPLDPHADFFHDWKEGHVESFCQRQYLVLAPVLDFTTTKHCIFDRNVRMPFVNGLDWSKAQGGANGLVLMAAIHDRYQKWGALHLGPHPLYAVKRFHTRQRDHFYKEREALVRFSRPEGRHEHLIHLLLSYEIGTKMFMIFPGAKYNLEEFWERSKSTEELPRSPEILIWLIQQCKGLAAGLCKVHDYQGQSEGRHGDIKPKNILLFEDSQNALGRLVLADFTLMRFHTPNSIVTEAPEVSFSRTYRPPEVEGLTSTAVSPRYDTWTLGCVYLEFITWYLLGYNAVYEASFQAQDGQKYESFTTARMSDDDGSTHPGDDKFFRRKQHWKNDAKWMKRLRLNSHASPAARGLLGLVRNHMLVIIPNNRCSMKMVEERLDTILSHCNNNAEY
ncbi:hypothetical protein K456DRAFT_1806554, partial [Colletotrichum gloeosporioides 23]